MEERLAAGVPVIMFPEGTSSDGTGLLPFRTSLFEAPVALGAPIHIASLRYSVPGDLEGQIMREKVAFWGDISFAAHLPRLLGLKRVDAMVEFAPGTIQADNRKVAAAEAEAAVRNLLGLLQDSH